MPSATPNRRSKHRAFTNAWIYRRHQGLGCLDASSMPAPWARTHCSAAPARAAVDDAGQYDRRLEKTAEADESAVSEDPGLVGGLGSIADALLERGLIGSAWLRLSTNAGYSQGGRPPCPVRSQNHTKSVEQGVRQTYCSPFSNTVRIPNGQKNLHGAPGSKSSTRVKRRTGPIINTRPNAEVRIRYGLWSCRRSLSSSAASDDNCIPA